MSLARFCMTMPGTPGLEAAPAIGAAYGGGFYAGRINVDGVIYNLVMSPRIEGEIPASVYKADTLGFTGNTSPYDGVLIQQNMVAAGIANFPAQQAAMAMAIGGFTDWYIPSRYEMEILYRNFKPTATQNSSSYGANPNSVPTKSNYTPSDPARTALTDFRSTGTNYLTSGYYYTATQGPSGALWVYYKRTTNGVEGEDEARFDYPIRVVRRVAVPIV